jgi:hypothetical protein
VLIFLFLISRKAHLPWLEQFKIFFSLNNSNDIFKLNFFLHNLIYGCLQFRIELIKLFDLSREPGSIIDGIELNSKQVVITTDPTLITVSPVIALLNFIVP